MQNAHFLVKLNMNSAIMNLKLFSIQKDTISFYFDHIV